MPYLKRGIVLIMTALCLLLISTPSNVWAKDVLVQVRVIYGEKTGDMLAPELENIQRELRGAFPLYKSFTLLERHQFELSEGDSADFKLPDKENTESKVLYKGVAEKDPHLLKMGLNLSGKISTEVKISPKSTFFQAGIFYKEGIIILAIRADLAAEAAVTKP